MYIGSKHAAAAAEDLRLPYVCPRCHYAAQAEVIGEGEGLAHAPYFVGGGGAEDRAAGYAMASASADGHRAVQLFPCPKCGARQRGAVSQNLVRSALFSVLAAILAAPLVYVAVMLAVDPDRTPGGTPMPATTEPTIAAIVVAALVIGLGTWRSFKKKLDRSRAIVTLHPENSGPG